MWVPSTSWYDEPTEIAFPLPGDWVLVGQATFAQDYPGEGPVRVWHFRGRELRGRQSPLAGQVVAAAPPGP